MAAGRQTDSVMAVVDGDDILVNNPRAINVGDFAAARASELKTMTEAIMTMGGMRRTFQKLPRHLRRRAMSHDLRRLPKRLRDSEERAMLKSTSLKKSAKRKGTGGEEEAPPPVKRSRRHRRRPGNLRAEYQRRQRKTVWLETHLWHAKRFRMAQLWGHRIPLHPSDKSARATYRATANHCLLQDISYLKVIELCGPQGLILKALTHLTSPLTGPTCAADMYLTGSRHGETMFYENDHYPEGAVGPVNFLWRAEVDEDKARGRGGASSSGPGGKFGATTTRALWLWAHPACSALLLGELHRAVDTEVDRDIGEVRVRQLEDGPLRFRLLGPLSQPVLQDALRTAGVGVTGQDESDQSRMWWEEYYATPDRMSTQVEQSSAWQTLGGALTPANMPPRCVLGLTVRDPRNHLPVKREKVLADTEGFDYTDALPGNVVQQFAPTLSRSPIWEESVRQAVTDTQMTVHQLNELRSKVMVPGQELNLGRRESRVPVLLLQQPGNAGLPGKAVAAGRSQWQGREGFGSGWDLVLPKGWAMAFWLALVFRGGRAAGLRESRRCHLQRALLHFPEACPDSRAGADWEGALAGQLAERFGRRPPAKRPNYGKLGTASPFRCPWAELLEVWRVAGRSDGDRPEAVDVVDAAGGNSARADNPRGVAEPLKEENLAGGELSEAFFVLRERSRLEDLRQALLGGQKPPKGRRKPSKAASHQAGLSGGAASGATDRSRNVASAAAVETSNGSLDPGGVSAATAPQAVGRTICLRMPGAARLSTGADRALVGVRLQMAHRGIPQAFAAICLPDDSDTALFTTDPNHSPTEPIHKGFKLPRTSKKKSGKKKSEKKKMTEDQPAGRATDGHEGVANDSASRRRALASCRRTAIGFVTDGANAFVSGRGQAVGYCCMLGLLALLEQRPLAPRNLVLIRNTTSVQYKFAYLDVMI